jgi:threonine dehydratase
MLRSSALGAELGVELFLKAELFQKTGSFKVRGALHKISRLGADDRRRGLVTISAGNHAAALAYAAATAGVACTVVMAADANPTKVRAARSYGAEVVLHGDVRQAFERCHQLERERGLLFIHAFDDPQIVAGAGSLGIECVEQVPDVDVVVVPVGGGGLISGVAVAVKHLRPEARIYGVEPEGAAAMWKSLQEGRPATLDHIETIADGLAPPMAGTLNFEIVRRQVDEVVKVSDAQILAAMRDLMTRCKLMAEPSGAAALAALQAGVLPTSPGQRVVAVVSGGNVDLAQLRVLL